MTALAWTAAGVAAAMALLLLVERAFPLRVQRTAWLRELATNLAFSVLAFGVSAVWVRPAVLRAMSWSEGREVGLVHLVAMRPDVLLLAPAQSPLAGPLALSQRPSLRSGPRGRHQLPLPLRRGRPVLDLPRRPGQRHRCLAAGVCGLRGRLSAQYLVPPQQRAAPDQAREVAQPIPRHAAHARDSPLPGAGGDGLELLRGLPLVGPAAPHAAAQRSANADRDRRTRLCEAGGQPPLGAGDDAVSPAARVLGNAGWRRPPARAREPESGSQSPGRLTGSTPAREPTLPLAPALLPTPFLSNRRCSTSRTSPSC
jgi:hypothetical protein